MPSFAQVNGLPPSILSMGFGESNALDRVPPASVTSIKPTGYGSNCPYFGSCCSSWPADQLPKNPKVNDRSRRPRQRKDIRNLGVGIIEAVYIPYAGSDTEEAAYDSEDDPPEESTALYPDSQTMKAPTGRRRTYGEVNAGFVEPEKSVAPQPSTVLVFKDGHQSDVLNYAIVGETLFDFAPARTRKIKVADLDLEATPKANDDRGIDFQMPSTQ